MAKNNKNKEVVLLPSGDGRVNGQNGKKTTRTKKLFCSLQATGNG
jgi:hypothetical protein